jgi:isoamylase
MDTPSSDFDPYSSFLEATGQDPVISRVKLIAEPWDIGWGGYDLGQFPAG